jgi:hypothetical protein
LRNNFSGTRGWLLLGEKSRVSIPEVTIAALDSVVSSTVARLIVREYSQYVY